MNTYCGPFALAFVTGKNTDEAADLLRRIGKYRIVKGVHDYVLGEALKSTVGVTAIVSLPKMTLRSWIKVRQRWNDKGTWVVSVTGHFLVYRDGILYDNRNHAGKPFEKHISSKRHVHHCWLINGETT